MGSRRLIQRKLTIHHWCDLASVQQRQDILTQRFGDPGLGQVALRSQGRAGDRQPAHHHRREVQLHLRALQKGDLNEPAVICQCLEIARDVVATDHIEDDIRPPSARRISTKSSLR